jgi:rubrerythrin
VTFTFRAKHKRNSARNEVSMDDRFVTIAAFDSPVEAHLVLGLLEGEGIRAMLSGEEAASVFAGVGIAEVTIQVHESDVARADALLDEYEKGDDEEAADEDDPEAVGWVCTLCGEVADDAAQVCPSCQTPRGAVRDRPPDDEPRSRRRSGMTRKPKAPDGAVSRRDDTTTAPATPVAAEDGVGVDVPDVTTLLGDDMAERAFLAAFIGLLTATGGIFYLLGGLLAAFPFVAYSGWMLLKLMTYSGELSPPGLRRLYGAIALDAVTVFFFVMLLGRFW